MRIATTSGSIYPVSAPDVRRNTLLAAVMATACALPGLAFAQIPPELQIYGRANVSYERITISNSPVAANNQSNWEVVDNSSRIGVRGKKDLGDGLSAFFQVESRVKLDDGAGSTLSSRDSYLGMQGGFGTIRLGRTIGPVYYATYDYISNHNHDTGTSSDALLASPVFGNQGFMNNTAWYSSPKFGAFSVDVAYSHLGETRIAGLSQPQYLGIVGAYDQGPLHLAVSYAGMKNTADLNPGPAVQANSDTVITVGGLYDFKKVIVGALFEKAESDLLTGSSKRNYYRVSVMVPVGKHEFHVNIGQVNHRLDVNSTSDGATQWTLGYNYNVTKEFKVYGFYTVVDNEANGNYGFRTSAPGVDNESIAVGARYNF